MILIQNIMSISYINNKLANTNFSIISNFFILYSIHLYLHSCVKYYYHIVPLNCIIIYLLHIDILTIIKFGKKIYTLKEADDELNKSLNIIDRIYLISQFFLFVISNMIFILIAVIILSLTITKGIEWIILYNTCKSRYVDGFYECYCN